MFVCAFGSNIPVGVLCLPCGPGSVLAALLSFLAPGAQESHFLPAVSYTPPGASHAPPGGFTVLHPLTQTASILFFQNFVPCPSRYQLV